jgi:hypothetical protein
MILRLQLYYARLNISSMLLTFRSTVVTLYSTHFNNKTVEYSHKVICLLPATTKQQLFPSVKFNQLPFVTEMQPVTLWIKKNLSTTYYVDFDCRWLTGCWENVLKRQEETYKPRILHVEKLYVMQAYFLLLHIIVFIITSSVLRQVHNLFKREFSTSGIYYFLLPCPEYSPFP